MRNPDIVWRIMWSGLSNPVIILSRLFSFWSSWLVIINFFFDSAIVVFWNVIVSHCSSDCWSSTTSCQILKDCGLIPLRLFKITIALRACKAFLSPNWARTKLIFVGKIFNPSAKRYDLSPNEPLQAMVGRDENSNQYHHRYAFYDWHSGLTIVFYSFE